MTEYRQPPYVSPRTRRYIKASEITTTAQAIDEVEQGRWLMIEYGSRRRPKPQHPGWIMSMTVHTLAVFVRAGRVFRARDTRPKDD